ncbi:MAG: hypothetical protein ACREMB_04875 [Candidatus Rokuibacteriota bacterium]
MAAQPLLAEPRRCPVCRTKIVLPDPEGLMVRNAILRVSASTGHATAKCPRCKAWVEVPLRYTG